MSLYVYWKGYFHNVIAHLYKSGEFVRLSAIIFNTNIWRLRQTKKKN